MTEVRDACQGSGTELFFDVDGAALTFDGSTTRHKPVLFALHGGPGGDHTIFKPTLSSLADTAQIIYVDHRGCGRSARGRSGDYTLGNTVEDIEALRRYLGLEQIAVLGFSYGGMVALTYATRHTASLSHLVLISTAASFQFLRRAQEVLAERGTQEQNKIAELLWAGAFESDEQLAEYYRVLGPLYSLRYDSAVAEKREAFAIRSYVALNEGFGGFLRTFDVRRHLTTITAPTLVIGARHDWICPPEFSEEIASSIPSSDLRIFENSGHNIFADEPDGLVGVVGGFLTHRRPRVSEE